MDTGIPHVYDLAAKKDTQLVDSEKAGNIVISGNTVVWDISLGWMADSYITIYDIVNKPTADFSASKVSGKAPLSVQFTSKTTGNPTDYYWVFEPSTSSDWNSHHAVTAVHTFKKPGKYTISLTVTNAAGSTTVTKKSYITVK